MTTPVVTPARAAAPSASWGAGGVPWFVWAAVVAATSAKVGILWDISWHRSIGRDTFWTPAHMAIYLGGVLAGLSCGWVVLKTTLWRTPDERAAAVTYGGFRGPLGAWGCIWGAFAMITSAPFDNWWHNAYGLDVKVLSPPHVILALGIWAVQLGALFMVLSLQNRTPEREPSRLHGLLAAYLVAILLQNATTVAIEQLGFPNDAHNALYYKVAAGVLPLLLVAVARAVRLPWPATTAAALYIAFSLLTIWIPLLLVVPAAAIDLLLRRAGRNRDWILSVAAGLAFLAVFSVVQWFFTEFLLTPHARNFFFGGDQWDYSSRLGPWRYEFWRIGSDPVTAGGLAIAAALAIVSARLGLWWGNWMQRLQR